MGSTPNPVGVLKSLLLVLLCMLFQMFSHAYADEEKDGPPELPSTSSIIPLASELSNRLTKFEQNLKNQSDFSDIVTISSTSEQKLNQASLLLAGENQSESLKWSAEREIRRNVNELNEARSRLYAQMKVLSREIDTLSGGKKEWQEEKRKWQEWQQLLKEEQSRQILRALNQARTDIDQALEQIDARLERLLELQARSVEIEQRINKMRAQTGLTTASVHMRNLSQPLPSMFSKAYLIQFDEEMMRITLGNLLALPLPDKQYLKEHLVEMLLQLIVTAFAVLVIIVNRDYWRESEHWGFLGKRPLSTGLLIGILMTVTVFPNVTESQFTVLVFRIVGGISFLLVINEILDDRSRKSIINMVVILYILTGFFSSIYLPIPLFRLFVLLASLVLLYSIWHSFKQHDKTDKGLSIYRLLLLSGALLFGLIAFFQLVGRAGVANYLFESTIISFSVLCGWGLFTYFIRGLLKWLFYLSPIWKIKMLRSESTRLVHWSAALIEFLVFIFIVIPVILTIWQVFDSQTEAISKVLSLGFSLGSVRIDLQLIITILAISYGSLMLSWVTPRVILDDIFIGKDIERGTKIAISTLFQYFIILCGILFLFSVLGLDLTKLTIILSALGVGIGLGLQGIVNDFISGLILLFERPVRVGDMVELDGHWCEIKEIGLRSVNVLTVEQANIIVPNSDLIRNHITNWTLGDHKVRISVRVGVAYGSDVTVVTSTLIACAKAHEQVLNKPVPEVIFSDFGESTLDFELRAWTMNSNSRFRIASELRQEINSKFREADIEIAFPQRDIHIRSADTSKTSTADGDGIQLADGSL